MHSLAPSYSFYTAVPNVGGWQNIVAYGCQNSIVIYAQTKQAVHTYVRTLTSRTAKDSSLTSERTHVALEEDGKMKGEIR